MPWPQNIRTMVDLPQIGAVNSCGRVGFRINVMPLKGKGRELTGALNESSFIDGGIFQKATIRLEGAKKLSVRGKNRATAEQIQSESG